MRLSIGKKQSSAQSVSAQVQDGNIASSSGHHGNRDKKTTSASLTDASSAAFHQNQQQLRRTAEDTGTGDVVMEPSELLSIDTREDICDIPVVVPKTAGHFVEGTCTKDSTDDDAIDWAVGGANVKLDEQSDVVSGILQQGGHKRKEGDSPSVFSFISAHPQMDGDESSDDINTAAGASDDSGNITGLLKSSSGDEGNHGNIWSPDDAEATTAQGLPSGSSGDGNLKDVLSSSPGLLDADLDPFSVGNPSLPDDGNQSSKLSFDLEGLVLSPEHSHLTMSTERTQLPRPDDDMEDIGVMVDDVSSSKVIKDGGFETVAIEDEDTLLEPSGDVFGLQREALGDNNDDDGGDGGYLPVSFGEESDSAPVVSMDEDGERREVTSVSVGSSRYDLELTFKDQFEVMQQMHGAKHRHFR